MLGTNQTFEGGGGAGCPLMSTCSPFCCILAIMLETQALLSLNVQSGGSKYLHGKSCLSPAVCLGAEDS